ncbi:hypothetical protein GLAREA_07459 [Glarea lozoyensis ATCC 20868]|uniref:Uncharacterized protein n=1 Tax=Glarea lozoyensis (strain ATCC 20868 / MF5171) TaxID=1116229 RepID=S3DJW1_GLAL2|nr:uncharacterized protein GLAREA_07459 [Glarea lozoyensis ATCC 20868]EPE32326.1 hypothetical protein GLAREA_07459 [Glarea lozoyensis ATCC 20868]
MSRADSLPSASNLAEYSDAELDEIIIVKDPEKLNEQDNFNLIQRLKARAAASKPVTAPIDVDDLFSRLEEITDKREFPPCESSCPSTVDATDEELHQAEVERQVRLYHELVAKGGRPTHPISLSYDVARSLPEYRDILSFWEITPDNPNNWACWWPQLYAWDMFLLNRRFSRAAGFPEYCQQTHDCLRRHGIERDFTLDEESDRQEKLATWIEYLGYHYNLYDLNARYVRRRQSSYDKEVEKVMDANVLKSSENRDSFDRFFLVELEGDQASAEKAVASAKWFVKSVEKELEKAQIFRLPLENIHLLERKLSQAEASLDKERDLHERCSRRYSIINSFMSRVALFEKAREKMNEENRLLPWILSQIPLIEFESTRHRSPDAIVVEGGQHEQQPQPVGMQDLRDESDPERLTRCSIPHSRALFEKSTVEETSHQQQIRKLKRQRIEDTSEEPPLKRQTRSCRTDNKTASPPPSQTRIKQDDYSQKSASPRLKSLPDTQHNFPFKSGQPKSCSGRVNPSDLGTTVSWKHMIGELRRSQYLVFCTRTPLGYSEIATMRPKASFGCRTEAVLPHERLWTTIVPVRSDELPGLCDVEILNEAYIGRT